MIVISIISLTSMGLFLGILLSLAARYLRVEGNPLQEEIENLLPGSQCGQCGYPGCTPAAEALANGEATVMLCPPGGPALVEQLAQKLGIEVNLSDVKETVPAFASVDESRCIGCTRCFKVCPTDAIIGAPKQIHAVVSDACIGCKKCVDVCPTECLGMHPIATTLKTWHWPKPVYSPLGAES